MTERALSPHTAASFTNSDEDGIGNGKAKRPTKKTTKKNKNKQTANTIITNINKKRTDPEG